MMKLPLQIKLQAVFALVLAFLLFTGAGMWWSVARNTAAFRAVNHTYDVLFYLDETLVKMLNTETATRGFVISGDAKFLEPYEAWAASLEQTLVKLHSLTQDEPNLRRQLTALESIVQRKADIQNRLIQLRRSGDIKGAQQLVASGQGNQAMDELRTLIDGMQNEEKQILQLRLAKAQERIRTTIAIVVFGSLLAIALACLANVIVRHDFNKRRQLLRQLMSSIPEALYFKDMQHRYTGLNDAECRMLNATREGEVLGRTADSFLSPERARLWREEEQKTLINDQPLIDSVERVAEADGTIRWFASTRAPIHNNRGKVTGLVGITRDITEQKLHEQMKDEFIATVSHELRTPLTSIAGSLGLLTGGAIGALPDSAVHLLKIAHANCERLVRLTDDILDVERIETGTTEFYREPIAVRPLVELAIEENLGFSETYGVRVRLEEGDEQGLVLADPDRLNQVITNLLSNAVKFSPRGDEVIVTIESNEAEVSISVRDHGPGIPKGFRKRIFDKFVQVDASDSRRKGGSGLGLSIVKRIVLRFGGKVDFVSAPGGGTIFRVVLPRLKQPADADGKGQARAIA